MTKNEELLLKLQAFKAITEYQIQWKSTTYEIPAPSFIIITKALPSVSADQATSWLNEWMRYETSQNIDVYNRVRFNEDSNVETILKLKNLIVQLDSSIQSLETLIEEESKPIEKCSAFSIEKNNDDGITFTFFNQSWLKRNIIVDLSLENTEKLKNELTQILNSKT